MVYALILIAGSGKRFDEKVSKNLLLVNNKPLFIYPIETCFKNSNIDKIILVVNKNEKVLINSFLKQYDEIKKTAIVLGSDISRYESLKNGISFIEKKYNPSLDDIIITLDGDRPLVSNDLINKSIEVTSIHNACNTSLKVYDSVINNKRNNFTYVDRTNLFTVQTPQTFKYSIWKNDTKQEGTDLFSSLNFKLRKENFIEGDYFNIKITTKKDIEVLAKLIDCLKI